MARIYNLKFLALLFAALVGVLAILPGSVFSQTIALTGYAWSDTIGWISLNCSNTSSCGTSNYAVSVATNGDLTGYAWSDNIGWIQFGNLSIGAMPSGSGTTATNANFSNGAMSGWIRALSADSLGWDGWISLKGSGYGVITTNGVFGGYAWGSDVVGWIDFSPALGQCTAVYSCQDSQTILYTNSSCITSTTQCAAPTFCSAGSSVCFYPPIEFDEGDNGLTGHLQILPLLVRAGTTATVYWDVSNASCMVEGNGNSWNTASGAEATSPITQQTTYTLDCTGVDGSTIHETATINILPVFQEL